MPTDSAIIVVYIVLILFIAARMLRERAVRMGIAMWIAPALFLLISAYPISQEGFITGPDITLFVVAAVAGVGIGWWLSTHSAIRADKTRSLLFVKASPWGVLIYVAAFIVRAVVRVFTVTPGSPGSLWSTVALFFAVGILIGMRVHWTREYAAAPETPPTPAKS